MNPAKTIWNRLDRIIGPMTISVLFGKFTGDLVTIYLTGQLGRMAGLWMGFFMAVSLFILWPLVESWYDNRGESKG
jgi:hypothetical protein